uniref:Uncharacterized protein n=1 Tax=Oryza punctata TaxID=4537 RepID=A0A0E0MF81_ORYPU
MAKCVKHNTQRVLFLFLLLVVCSTIPTQTRGETTSKIGSNMPMGVKNAFRVGGVKLNVCAQTAGGFYCCSKDQLCYPTLEQCIPKCNYKEKARRGLRG